MASSALESMAPTPTKTTSSPSKRKITPSSELSSPAKRMTIFQTGRLPASQSVTPASDNKLSPLRPSLPEEFQITKTDAPSVNSCRHIILDFDLHKNRDLWYQKGIPSALMKVFPGAQGVSWDDLFLTFRMDQLPPKPWPETVAGVPVLFTVGAFGNGPLDKLLKNPPMPRVQKMKILQEINVREEAQDKQVEIFQRHVEEIFQYFKRTNIKVTQIQHWPNWIIIVLKDKSQNIEKVPRNIMHMPCYLLFDEDIIPQRQPALRLKEPELTVFDDAVYQALRPGVMVTCSPCSNGPYWTTTSGVLVEDSSGDKYVTVAAHGFRNLGPVHHPKSEGRVIGEIALDFSSSFNISLMKLNENETFVNQTFDSADGRGRKLASLAPTRKVKHGDPVFMDNPYMGSCYNQVTSMVYEPYKLFDEDPKQYWVCVGSWIWTGEDSSQVMPDGICGSPLWNEDDEVVGFFRFVGTGLYKGFSYCTGAENLLKKGYEICQEYD